MKHIFLYFYLGLLTEMAEKTSPGILEHTNFHCLKPQLVLSPLLRPFIPEHRLPFTSVEASLVSQPVLPIIKPTCPA